MSLLLLLGAPGTPGTAADSEAGVGITLAGDAIAAGALNGDTAVAFTLGSDTVVATAGSEANANAAAVMLADDVTLAEARSGERRKADPFTGTLA